MTDNKKHISPDDHNNKTDIVEKYNDIMNNFQDNPIFNNEWKKKGDYYEKVSIYDETQICITGTL